MTRLVVSREADPDLDAVLSYLEREAGARTACSYAERFRKSIAFLAVFPGGAKPPSSSWPERSHIHRLPLYPHLRLRRRRGYAGDASDRTRPTQYNNAIGPARS